MSAVVVLPSDEDFDIDARFLVKLMYRGELITLFRGHRSSAGSTFAFSMV